MRELEWRQFSMLLICYLVAKSCLTLVVCTPLGFFVHGIFPGKAGFPCPPPGDLSDPGIELTSPVSPTLQADSSPLEPCCCWCC